MIYLDKSTVQIPTRLSMYALYLQSLQTCHHNSNLKPSGETEYGATQIPTSFVQIFRSGFVCSISNRRKILHTRSPSPDLIRSID